MAKAAIINNNGSVAIKFMLHGYLYKMSKLGKADDTRVLALATRLCLSINTDILNGSFTATCNDELFTQYHPRAKLEASHRANQVKKLAMDKTATPESELFDLWLKQYESKNCYSTVKYCLGLDDCAVTTYNTRLMFAKKFGRWLVSEGYRDVSQFESLKPRQVTQLDKVQNRESFTVLEVRSILDAFKTNHFAFYPFVLFLFKTGTRTSEAIGIQVKNVNFLTNVISIESSLSKNQSKNQTESRVRKSTKTGESRYLKLSTDLAVVLKPLCEGLKADDLVFTFKGLPIDSGDLLAQAWRAILVGLGIEYRPLYATRHTAISHYIANTRDVFAAAKFAGHKDTKQIMSTYGHLLQLPECPDY